MGGGQQVQFTPLDNTVLDEIGRKSGAAVSIDVKEPVLTMMSTGMTAGPEFLNLDSHPVHTSFRYSEGDFFLTSLSCEMSLKVAQIDKKVRNISYLLRN